ncbi:MetQ/NlpA family ABC transporter substrate-binding protein [Candidatus Chlamydia sanziniae]|uniref:MetQ/NlpA family ABC transporter substrate-binding protein n=1 Tax=Candidatus Chlamydia sanziniae TaxID=1806891 RepID=UPI003B849731
MTWLRLRRVISLTLFLTSCQKQESEDVIRIAASPIPHAELLYTLQGEAKTLGLKLKILPIDDYRIPNRLLLDKQIEANYFQHEAFLQDECRRYGSLGKLVPFIKVHLEPMGIYSKKFSSLQELKNKRKITITIPVDCTNAQRALQLLEECQLIISKQPIDLNTTSRDVCGKDNRNITIVEVAAPLLMGSLSDTDAAVIPGHFAIAGGFSPKVDSLCLENLDMSKYTNIVVIRDEDLNTCAMLKLKKLFQSSAVKNFFDLKYQGNIITIVEENEK